jgi:hypothetical protein
MSYTITIQPQPQTIVLKEIEIVAIRDEFIQQRIWAQIKNFPRSIILWSGSTEYATASAWNNDTALARITELLTLSADVLQFV